MNHLGYTLTALWLGLGLTDIALHSHTRLHNTTTPPSAQTQDRLAVAHHHLKWLTTLALFSAATVWTENEQLHWTTTTVFGALTLLVLSVYIRQQVPETEKTKHERTQASS